MPVCTAGAGGAQTGAHAAGLGQHTQQHTEQTAHTENTFFYPQAWFATPQWFATPYCTAAVDTGRVC